MRQGTAERRRLRRLERFEDHRIVSTRVRPGHHARIVDVSAAGVLIETAYRLLPGTSVELQVETEKTHTRVRGEVLRCAVAGLRADVVSYRGAIRFDRHLPWFVDESGDRGGSAETRPAHPPRAASTPEVI
jgi:PilZ domain-containing protein